jgi:hypothetical protein
MAAKMGPLYRNITIQLQVFQPKTDADCKMCGELAAKLISKPLGFEVEDPGMWKE